MSNYLKRLSFLVTILKANESTSDQLLELLLENDFSISQRQLQRDLKSLEDILNKDEYLKTHFFEGKKHFYISVSSLPNHNSAANTYQGIRYTKFYHQHLDPVKIETLETLETAIHQSRTLDVKLVKDDETGDNTGLDGSQFKICPVDLIYHRSSYYVACFNLKTEGIEVFGIRQLVQIKIGKPFFDQNNLKDLVANELNKRFGITKNMDERIYDIKIEFTSATGRFIEDHHWHSSQKITKKDGNYIITMQCGINRELMGWLFQWMYNAKVIEPPILKDFYKRTLQECKATVKKQTPFVYKNIFTN